MRIEPTAKADVFCVACSPGFWHSIFGMGRERGWVAISVRTYQSHRTQQNPPQNQRVVQQDYTVDESGATLNAVSRSSDVREEERIMAQMAAASNNQPTTSIFIRDWKVRRAPAGLHTRAVGQCLPYARPSDAPYGPSHGHTQSR